MIGKAVLMLAAVLLALGCARTDTGESASGGHRQAEVGSVQAAPEHQIGRIGTYDSRAVAIAYGRSEAFLAHTRDLHERHTRALAAGDRQTASKLQAEGQSLQARIHLQGFSNAPVDEILAKVQDRLPQIARQRNVLAIVPRANYRDDQLEVVDVTDDLVDLFNPDERTRTIITDLKRRSPLPIEEVARMDHQKH